jgi:Ca2+/Na+ antiporter
MAKCPKCGAAQDWWKVLRFTKTELMSCWRCGAFLALDSQRATVLVGGLIALLFIPETRLLPLEGGPLWFVGVLAVYTPFYVFYIKLNEVGHSELEVTAEQDRLFQKYSKNRHRSNLLGHLFLWGGLMVLMTSAFSSLFGESEVIPALSLSAMTVGLILLSLTRCPFCRKITVRVLFSSTNRCINCHREIDAND